MLTEADHAAFLDLLYGAAVEQGDWAPVIARFADLIGGAKAWKPDLDVASGAGRGVLARIDPAAQDAYFQHYAALNPFVQPVIAQPAAPWPLAVMTDEDRFERDEFVRTEYYSDFLRPQDIGSVVVVRLGRSGSTLSTLNITRPEHKGRFERSELEVARQLHPHLIRAFNLGGKFAALSGFAGGLAEALDRSLHGVLLLDDAGRVRHANAVAERLLKERGGLSIVGGRLSAARSEPARQLEALIGRASRAHGPSRGGGSMAIATPSRARPLSLIVAPLSPERATAAGAPSVLVCVTDLEAGVSLPQQQLRDLFGLTPAETRLALALFEGCAPKEAAERFGVSPHTVHTQLVHVFEKTGVNRQSDLVRLMMRVAGVSLDPG
ncbi:MAG TPA: helix-turn-helix transcriptional regulator [Caulobacteraceae bacterium]